MLKFKFKMWKLKYKILTVISLISGLFVISTLQIMYGLSFKPITLLNIRDFSFLGFALGLIIFIVIPILIFYIFIHFIREKRIIVEEKDEL